MKEFFRAFDESGLSHVEHQIVTMVGDCRHSFDVAFDALAAGGDTDEPGRDVRETDDRINHLEQEIRRELLVHTSVHGSSDISSVLAYLMITRMLERVGDQNKNILDLALQGVSLAEAEDRAQLLGYRRELSQLLGRAAEVFTERSEEQARHILDRTDELLDEFDDLIRAQIRSEAPATHAVPRALLYRYLKRIAANVANMVSAVVLPLDKIDYYGSTLDRDE